MFTEALAMSSGGSGGGDTFTGIAGKYTWARTDYSFAVPSGVTRVIVVGKYYAKRVNESDITITGGTATLIGHGNGAEGTAGTGTIYYDVVPTSSTLSVSLASNGGSEASVDILY